MDRKWLSSIPGCKGKMVLPQRQRWAPSPSLCGTLLRPLPAFSQLGPTRGILAPPTGGSLPRLIICFISLQIAPATAARGVWEGCWTWPRECENRCLVLSCQNSCTLQLGSGWHDQEVTVCRLNKYSHCQPYGTGRKPRPKQLKACPKLYSFGSKILNLGTTMIPCKHSTICLYANCSGSRSVTFIGIPKGLNHCSGV